MGVQSSEGNMDNIASLQGFHDQVGSAIAAHAAWKKRLLAAIEGGQSDWSPEQVRQDDKCTLGEWLASVPQELRDETFLAVHAAHEKFHHCAAEVLEQALSGANDAARANLSSGSAYSTASFQLISALAKWRSLLDA